MRRLLLAQRHAYFSGVKVQEGFKRIKILYTMCDLQILLISSVDLHSSVNKISYRIVSHYKYFHRQSYLFMQIFLLMNTLIEDIITQFCILALGDQAQFYSLHLQRILSYNPRPLFYSKLLLRVLLDSQTRSNSLLEICNANNPTLIDSQNYLNLNLKMSK